MAEVDSSLTTKCEKTLCFFKCYGVSLNVWYRCELKTEKDSVSDR